MMPYYNIDLMVPTLNFSNKRFKGMTVSAMTIINFHLLEIGNMHTL